MLFFKTLINEYQSSNKMGKKRKCLATTTYLQRAERTYKSGINDQLFFHYSSLEMFINICNNFEVSSNKLLHNEYINIILIFLNLN